MIQIASCGRRGMDQLNAAEKLVIGALRLWKVLRAERLATLPELYRRLAPAGGAMLAVPLDDFFKQVVAWRGCPHGSRIRHSNQLICDEVATLDLLHAAPALCWRGSKGNASSLRMLSACILAKLFTAELGVQFGTSPIVPSDDPTTEHPKTRFSIF